MDKSRLILLDTRPGWDGQTDALFFDPGDKAQPFVIAHGVEFDGENVEWRSGSYRSDLLDALCEFRGVVNPRYAVPGATPDDVSELYGVADQEIAELIAGVVNRRMSNVDDLYSQDLYAVSQEFWNDVSDGREHGMSREEAVDAAKKRLVAELEGTQYLPHVSDTLVAGTMYLDVNGYDFNSRRVEDAAASETIGDDVAEKSCVKLTYSMSLVEEAMAKEGIPLTQPNVAFMSDKVARAIRDDAFENAGHIASETASFWKGEVPDRALSSPSQVRSQAAAVAQSAGAVENQKQQRKR